MRRAKCDATQFNFEELPNLDPKGESLFLKFVFQKKVSMSWKSFRSKDFTDDDKFFKRRVSGLIKIFLREKKSLVFSCNTLWAAYFLIQNSSPCF